jgi:hypothetical protein
MMPHSAGSTSQTLEGSGTVDEATFPATKKLRVPSIGAKSVLVLVPMMGTAK